MGRSSRRHRDYRASTMLQSRDYAEAVFVRIRFFRWISSKGGDDGSSPLPSLEFTCTSKGEQRVIVQGWTIFACYASTLKFAIALPFSCSLPCYRFDLSRDLNEIGPFRNSVSQSMYQGTRNGKI